MTLGIREHHERDGDWWKPENSAVRLAGTFAWQDQVGTVRLHRSFEPLRGGSIARPESYPVLHGTLSNGTKVTLLNSFIERETTNFGPEGIFTSATLSVAQAIFGFHADQRTKYTRLVGTIPGLDVWLTRDPWQVSRDEQNLVIQGANGRVRTFTFSDFTARLHLNRRVKQSRDQELGIEREAAVSIEASAPQELPWFVEKLSCILSFLSMLGGTTFAPEKLGLETECENEVNYLVRLAYPQLCEFKASQDFFLIESKVGNLEDELVNWVADYEKLRLPAQLALSVFSSINALQSHMQFLSLMQVCEGFHRVKHAGLYMDQETYDKKIAPVITAAIPRRSAAAVCDVPSDPHLASLKSRIKFGNEKSLRNRMKELAESLEDPIRTLILGADGKVPESWLATRNYYTHWDENNKSGVLDGTDMYFVNARLRVFVRCLFLLHLGVSTKVLHNPCTSHFFRDWAEVHHSNSSGKAEAPFKDALNRPAS